MFRKVLDNILPWPKKSIPPVPTNASEAFDTPSAPSSDTSREVASVLGQITVSEFEQMLTRVEVAKKVAHHAGINRNRVNRLFRVLGLMALGTILLAYFPPSCTREKLPVDKAPVALAAFPVFGALPSAGRTGHVAVIRLADEIDGTLHGAPVAANTPLYLETAFAAAEEDPDLAGVILEIDSPGGGAAASAQSYRIVRAACERLAKRNVRVIAHTSLGAYSGGYYIAMGVGNGNFFADPSADVANIGVIMKMFNTALLGEMLGITENIVKTGPLKSTGAQWEKFTPAQRAMLQESIDDSFELFLQAVSESRNLDIATLRRESQLSLGAANGAWFSAKRALERKLIDGIIPVEDLYKQAASAIPDRKEFKNIELVKYRARLGVTERVTKGLGKAAGIFLRSMLSEMTHRDAPMRSEKE